jgi:MFS family permease
MGPYRRVFARPVLRRVMPGMAMSALGDGMSFVAVAWLALTIAPAGQAAVWTGLAVAAYSLPATVGAAVFGRWVRGFGGARLVAVDASVRAVALGAIAALALFDRLNATGYVVLLALSSLLHAWGYAGAYTLVAEELPEEDRVAGNALVSTFTQGAMVVGPALAGVVTAAVGPAWVIAADAATFAALAAVCWPLPSRPATPADPDAAADAPSAGGWRTILARPSLVGLIAITCVFFFLYGPVEVALPIHVAEELRGSAGVLGLFWAVFGVGAVIGSLAAGLLRRGSPWVIIVAIIVGWGAALLPVGLTDAVGPGLVGFAIGGLIYGPFTAISTALVQRISPPAVLSRVLATKTALTTPSTAAGTLLGGPLVAAIGGQATLLWSGVATIGFGAVVAAVVGLARTRRPPSAPAASPPSAASPPIGSSIMKLTS